MGDSQKDRMKWQWPGLARIDGAWGQGSSRGAFLPLNEEICPLFPFYSHAIAHAALSDWSDLKIKLRSPVKILFGSKNHF